MPKSAVIVAHGGVGSPERFKDGPAKAVRTAWRALNRSGSGRGLRDKQSVLDAAVAGAVVLEDDPRFNAGTGSVIRLDGKTIEMDAAVMDSDGHFGAVAGIQGVKNPVKVARLLVDSPHTFLCGSGATSFARLKGFPEYNPETPRARRRFRQRIRQLKTKRLPLWATIWRKSSFRRLVINSLRETDTIGIVVSDGEGNFAAASSSGGISLGLPGRVGDSPLIGAGLYVGKAGAVTATGIGEEITKTLLSLRVYEKLEQGLNPQSACEWGVGLFPKDIPIGLIAVSSEGYGIADNQTMAIGLFPVAVRQ